MKTLVINSFLTCALSFSTFTIISCGNSKQEINSKVDQRTKEIEDSLKNAYKAKINLDFIKTFEGSIDNQYEIIAKLNSNSGKLTGKYYYKGNTGFLNLTGTVDELGNIHFNEFDSKDRMTGVFEGRFINENKIEGTWKTPNEKQSKSLNLISSNTEFKPIASQAKSINGIYLAGNKSLIIKKISDNSILFDIDVSTQRCIGSFKETAKYIGNDTWTYKGSECDELKFIYKDQNIIVSENNCSNHGSGCFFGGTYILKSKK